jgi:hypothetical protein
VRLAPIARELDRLALPRRRSASPLTCASLSCLQNKRAIYDEYGEEALKSGAPPPGSGGFGGGFPGGGGGGFHGGGGMGGGGMEDILK